MVTTRVNLKPIGPIATNWAPLWNYLILAVQVHTQHTADYTENSIGPRTEIIFSWLFTYSQQHTADYTEKIIGLRTEIIYSRLFKYTQQHIADFTENIIWASHLLRPTLYTTNLVIMCIYTSLIYGICIYVVKSQLE